MYFQDQTIFQGNIQNEMGFFLTFSVKLVNSMRYSVLGVSDIEIRDGLLMIFVFFILLLFTSIYLLKKGIGIRD